MECPVELEKIYELGISDDVTELDNIVEAGNDVVSLFEEEKKLDVISEAEIVDSDPWETGIVVSLREEIPSDGEPAEDSIKVEVLTMLCTEDL